ncbi:SCO family protein [Thioclava sp. GXIMD4216]|uniref:SCO family protein n=1 Tax=Thioclava sp. GXIMD4216 TaxID=3131929 RepID=UPI0030CBCD44
MFRSGERFALFMTGLALVMTLGMVVYDKVVLPKYRAAQAAVMGQGEYVLQATDGQDFTYDSLKGSPSAVFFGFTHCPEVCPTTMGDLATWKEDIPGATDLRVYFVTVDPARDRLDQLRDYVSWIPGVIGVTGTQAEIDKAIKAYNVYAKKVVFDDGSYTMDHSAFVMLFDENGRYVDSVVYGEPLEVAEARIKNLVDGNPLGRGSVLPNDLLGILCLEAVKIFGA